MFDFFVSMNMMRNNQASIGHFWKIFRISKMLARFKIPISQQIFNNYLGFSVAQNQRVVLFLTSWFLPVSFS